jgi:hypothetical protein
MGFSRTSNCYFKWTRTLVPLGLFVGLVLGPYHSIQKAVSDESPVAATEYNLKLARLCATAKFISWPDDGPGAKKPFVIAVIAPDPFGNGLKKLSERTRKDRPIATKLIRSVEDYSECHLLFIPDGADPKVVDAILQKVTNQPVLVWRDQPGPQDSQKASCTFMRQGESLFIEADPKELQRVGLSPDGRLMSLNIVRVVKDVQER